MVLNHITFYYSLMLWNYIICHSIIPAIRLPYNMIYIYFLASAHWIAWLWLPLNVFAFNLPILNLLKIVNILLMRRLLTLSTKFGIQVLSYQPICLLMHITWYGKSLRVLGIIKRTCYFAGKIFTWIWDGFVGY